MVAYWNFREILDVRPDSPSFTCVGTTQKGARCSNSFISNSDLSSAAGLLNNMDRCKNLKSSYQYLEDLANITLCPRWHRKPSHSQINQTCRKWQLAIAEYDRVVMKEVLRRLKTIERVYIDEQEEEKKYKPSTSSSRILKTQDANALISKRAPVIKPVLEDPFARDSKIAPSLASVSRVPTQSHELTQTKQTNTSLSQSQSHPLASKIKLEKENQYQFSNTSVLHKFGMQTPPDTPESSVKEEPHQETVDELQSTPTKSNTRKMIQPRSVKLQSTTVTTSHAAVSAQISLTPESTLVPNSLFGDKTGSQTPLPAFNFAFTQDGPHPPKKSSERPSSQQSQTPSTIETASGFDFGIEYKIPSKSFDFNPSQEVSCSTLLPGKYSTVWEAMSPQSECLKEANISPKPSSLPETIAPAVETAPITYLEPPQTPRQVKEESFGFANVTPESIRYKSYLPAPQKNGLITPPDTPDGSATSDIYTGPLKNGFPGFSIQPPVVVRKPVLNEKTADVQVQKTCSACGMIGSGTCHCESREKSIKTGCFPSLGLRKLKKKVARKMNVLRTRISGKFPDTDKS